MLPALDTYMYIKSLMRENKHNLVEEKQNVVGKYQNFSD